MSFRMASTRYTFLTLYRDALMKKLHLLDAMQTFRHFNSKAFMIEVEDRSTETLLLLIQEYTFLGTTYIMSGERTVECNLWG